MLDTDKYSAMVRRFIDFDSDMKITAQTWTNVWWLLQEYHTRSEEMQRQQRILSMHTLFMDIKHSDESVSLAGKIIPVQEFAVLDDRGVAWKVAMKFFSQMCDARRKKRLVAAIQNSQCAKCCSALASHYM